jgi:hypothetical protein
MKTVHQIQITDEYLKVAQRLVLSQQTFTRWLCVNPWFSWLPPIIFSGYLVGMAFYRILDLFSGVLFGSLLIVSLANLISKPRSLAKARNRNPLRGTVVAQSTGENGIDSVSSLGSSHLHWAAFSRALVYPKGILRKLKTRNYVWLPDESLTEGSPEDVRQLVTEHVKDVEIPPEMI